MWVKELNVQKASMVAPSYGLGPSEYQSLKELGNTIASRLFYKQVSNPQYNEPFNLKTFQPPLRPRGTSGI